MKRSLIFNTILYGAILFMSNAYYAMAANITLINAEGNVIHTITADEFNAYPQKTICTSTPWTDINKKACFTGVRIKDIINKYNIPSDTLNFHALNDYDVNIPKSDINDYDIILASHMNGKQLEVRNFGPYMVIYPLDQYQNKLNRPDHLARFIWQVDKIGPGK
ncbi:molybdopterin-dependent oxidoreductase [Klebsiella aerogenes]|uniref:molybdopterin-dependent oxidoreductase n=1 Tax=Klebsiella aerogenes TaxID=548 RepID=UPI002E318564|nr:molybdopterin-dependent oxidoreductase [Klebsiella aerogenes]MED7793150.1 molybdopterin-dependent oxidoreductase [Klebsiella aerogenes]